MRWKREASLSERVSAMNDIFRYLTEDHETEEYLTFFTLLEKIKNIPPLLDFYGEEFVQYLIELLPKIEDKYDRALLIETLVQCFYSCEAVDKTYCLELLDEYMLCVREYAANIDDIIQCLYGFFHAGISKSETVVKLVENLDSKEYLLRILSRLEIDDSVNVSKDRSEWLAEAKELSSISWRSGIIAQFLLLAHPHVRKYAEVSQITFLYDSYEGVYADCWPRGLLPNRKETLIESNVLSIKEIRILERLDELINTQKKDLDSPEVRELYDVFFEGKDPFEVIFSLQGKEIRNE